MSIFFCDMKKICNFVSKQMCMNILFDHQIFYKKYGGASKYFVKMIASMPEGSWKTTALLSSNEYVKDTGLFKTYPYLFRGQALVLDYINRPYTNKVLRKGDYDVFHQTNFGTYCLKSVGQKPMVTTYHDANLSTIDPHPYIVKMQEASVRRADAVVVVSKNTKQDLLHLFDIDEKKVKVIYHGIDIPDTDILHGQPLFPFPYILYVGRRSEYKNFSRFIKAFSLMKHQYPDLRVVCTFTPFTKQELEFFSSLGVEENIIHIYADEMMMKQLYHQALYFVFPSLYEGFGMPILEAWSCGCPVALANASCFPEIAGDGALYFDPMSVDDIHDKMKQLVDRLELRQSLIEKGKERVKMFSWKKCAEQHIQLYQSLI